MSILGPILIVTMVVLFLIFSIIYKMNEKVKNTEKLEAFLKENKNPAKLYLKGYNYLLFTLNINVYSVDEDKPIFFREGLKWGIYLSEGKHMLNILASTERPGIASKRVITTYGPLDVGINAKKDGLYQLTLKKGKLDLQEI